jgi:curved DNA-binding protein CbpA
MNRALDRVAASSGLTDRRTSYKRTENGVTTYYDKRTNNKLLSIVRPGTNGSRDGKIILHQQSDRKATLGVQLPNGNSRVTKVDMSKGDIVLTVTDASAQFDLAESAESTREVIAPNQSALRTLSPGGPDTISSVMRSGAGTKHSMRVGAFNNQPVVLYNQDAVRQPQIVQEGRGFGGGSQQNVGLAQGDVRTADQNQIARKSDGGSQATDGTGRPTGSDAPETAQGEASPESNNTQQTTQELNPASADLNITDINPEGHPLILGYDQNNEEGVTTSNFLDIRAQSSFGDSETTMQYARATGYMIGIGNSATLRNFLPSLVSELTGTEYQDIKTDCKKSMDADRNAWAGFETVVARDDLVNHAMFSLLTPEDQAAVNEMSPDTGNVTLQYTFGDSHFRLQDKNENQESQTTTTFENLSQKDLSQVSETLMMESARDGVNVVIQGDISQGVQSASYERENGASEGTITVVCGGDQNNVRETTVKEIKETGPTGNDSAATVGFMREVGEKLMGAGGQYADRKVSIKNDSSASKDSVKIKREDPSNSARMTEVVWTRSETKADSPTRKAMQPPVDEGGAKDKPVTAAAKSNSGTATLLDLAASFLGASWLTSPGDSIPSDPYSGASGEPVTPTASHEEKTTPDQSTIEEAKNAISATMSRADMIIGREKTGIKEIKKNRASSGWFGALSRTLTLSDPYTLDIKNCKQKIAIMNTAKKFLNEAKSILSSGKELDAKSMGKVKTLVNQARRLAGMREVTTAFAVSDQAPTSPGVNRVDTDTERYEVEQEALTVTKDVSVAVITSVGGGAMGAAAKTGVGIRALAASGARVGGVSAGAVSGSENAYAVAQGEKSISEAVKDTAKDTAIGAGVGALAAPVGAAGRKMMAGARNKLAQSAARSSRAGASGASAKPQTKMASTKGANKSKATVSEKPQPPKKKSVRTNSPRSQRRGFVPIRPPKSSSARPNMTRSQRASKPKASKGKAAVSHAKPPPLPKRAKAQQASAQKAGNGKAAVSHAKPPPLPKRAKAQQASAQKTANDRSKPDVAKPQKAPQPKANNERAGSGPTKQPQAQPARSKPTRDPSPRNPAEEKFTFNSGGKTYTTTKGKMANMIADAVQAGEVQIRVNGRGKNFGKLLTNNPDINNLVRNNLLSIWGLKPGASSAQINKVYRELSIKYHPDKHNQDFGAQKVVNNIHEFLSR